MPSMWSKCLWVTKMWLSVQPRILQVGDDRVGVGRVDRHRLAALRFVQEHGEIVGAGHELSDVESRHAGDSGIKPSTQY